MQEQKSSFGNLIFMAIAASFAIAIMRTLQFDGGMIFSALFVAISSLFGHGIYKLFFTNFKTSTIFIILFALLGIILLLLTAESNKRSVLDNLPAAEPELSKSVLTDNSLEKMMDRFNEKQAELVKIPERKSLVKNPYLKEKVVFYSKGISFGESDAKWIFDSSNSNLNNLVAENPEDVKTSVLKVCQQLKSENPYFVNNGENKREIAVFYWKCNLTIIDRTLSAVIFEKTFERKPSELSIIKDDSTEKYESPMPDFAIQSFLEKLPVK